MTAAWVRGNIRITASAISEIERAGREAYARDETFDITTVGIEFGVILGSIRRAAESLEAGDAKEVAISTDKMITLIRVINKGYFVALTLSPDANLGKGRYLLRLLAPKLAEELAA